MMNKILHSFVVLGAVGFTACIESASNVAGDDASAVKGAVRIDLTSNSTMILVPVSSGDRLSKVTSVIGSTTMAASSAVSSTPVEVGTINFTNVSYQINGDTQCNQNLQSGLPSCTFPDQIDNGQPVIAQVEQSSSVSEAPTGISQVAMPMAGMVCAGHGSYPTRIWQKQFTVALAGPAEELDKISEAKYTVYSSYGQTYTGTSRANNFDAGASFLTPVTSWTVDKVTVTTKSGTSLSLAGARLSWVDTDPAKKAGQNCEPTSD